MAAKDTSEDAKPDDQEAGHSLDMSQAAVKKMIGEAREKGYITYDQLNTVLPPDQVSSEQIEDVMSMLSEMGINIIEDEDAEEEEAKGSTELTTTDGAREVAVSSGTTEKLDRTDDPVRMYLREMGSVELLSREGEIAIAKRIEAGRNTMIAGLCESPLTFQAITIWRDELLSEDILLRDVIDLEATFGNLVADAMREAMGADLALTNGGGIRAKATYSVGQELTAGDIFAELPFGNKTVLLELSGQAVIDAVENGVSCVEDGCGKFPHISGFSFTADMSQPAGSRVTSVMVGGAEIDPAGTYTLATNDFVARGGDAYTSFASANVLIDGDSSVLMASQVVDYIRAAGEVAPMVEGRITLN